jgi:glutathione S-transferase kappa 1
MSVATKKSFELFYDVISPYSWIAFEELCRYRTKWNIDLKLKPMFLGGVMANSSNHPPITVPAKARYMFHDLTRLRQLYQIPLNAPSNPTELLLVKGSLNAQRFLTAVEQQRPELVEPLSRELWMRAWSRDEDITTNDSLKQVGQVVGLSDADTNMFLELIKESRVKEQLKRVTQEALDAGAFGAPTIIVHDADNKKHLIFGSDRIQVIAMLLNEQYVGPLRELAKSKI